MDALTKRKNSFKNICQDFALYIKIEALALFPSVYYYYFLYALIEKKTYIYIIFMYIYMGAYSTRLFGRCRPKTNLSEIL